MSERAVLHAEQDDDGLWRWFRKNRLGKRMGPRSTEGFHSAQALTQAVERLFDRPLVIVGERYPRG